MKRLRPIVVAWSVVFGIALGFGLCRKYGARAREGSSVATKAATGRPVTAEGGFIPNPATTAAPTGEGPQRSR